MLTYKIFCSHLAYAEWLQKYLIPCPFKKITGIDCPGCGFQRALIELLSGNLKASLRLYPAVIPIVIIILLTLFGNHFKWFQNPYLKKSLYLFSAGIIITSYFIKLSQYF